MVRYLKLLLALISLACGIFYAKFPEKAIRKQQSFYEKINWRIEPISMKKEIKNTQLMGILLILLSVFIFMLVGI